MNKIIKLICLSIITFQFTSCKKEIKKEDIKPQKTNTKYAYSLSKAENIIDFTAYKTSEKLPVKGTFKKIEITKGGEANSIKDAINGAEFKIPVSSIETKNDSRNLKIQKFFFNIMENTLNLTGKLMLSNETSGIVSFTMNGITKELPFNYTIIENAFTMNATMDINSWNGQEAISSLNTACKELHKGEDGVSKTWNDVSINIVSTFH